MDTLWNWGKRLVTFGADTAVVAMSAYFFWRGRQGEIGALGVFDTERLRVMRLRSAFRACDSARAFIVRGCLPRAQASVSASCLPDPQDTLVRLTRLKKSRRSAGGAGKQVSPEDRALEKSASYAAWTAVRASSIARVFAASYAVALSEAIVRTQCAVAAASAASGHGAPGDDGYGGEDSGSDEDEDGSASAKTSTSSSPSSSSSSSSSSRSTSHPDPDALAEWRRGNAAPLYSHAIQSASGRALFAPADHLFSLGTRSLTVRVRAAVDECLAGIGLDEKVGPGQLASLLADVRARVESPTWVPRPAEDAGAESDAALLEVFGRITSTARAPAAAGGAKGAKGAVRFEDEVKAEAIADGANDAPLTPRQEDAGYAQVQTPQVARATYATPDAHERAALDSEAKRSSSEPSLSSSEPSSASSSSSASWEAPWDTPAARVAALAAGAHPLSRYVFDPRSDPANASGGNASGGNASGGNASEPLALWVWDLLDSPNFAEHLSAALDTALNLAAESLEDVQRKSAARCAALNSSARPHAQGASAEHESVPFARIIPAIARLSIELLDDESSTSATLLSQLADTPGASDYAAAIMLAGDSDDEGNTSGL